LFWRSEKSSAAYSDYTIAQGDVPAAVVLCLHIAGLSALMLVVLAGWIGHPSTFKNIAPVAVWVIGWGGLSFVSAFVGSVWRFINPWTVAFGFAELLARQWTRPLSLAWPYPACLGVWPACALFLAFAWLELIAPGRDVPMNIAKAVAVYSGLTWTGFVLFGREVWLKVGEAFSVAFELFGRFAPIHLSKDKHWHCTLRPYATGLLLHE